MIRAFLVTADLNPRITDATFLRCGPNWLVGDGDGGDCRDCGDGGGDCGDGGGGLDRDAMHCVSIIIPNHQNTMKMIGHDNKFTQCQMHVWS
jgi:hypothetical protein